MISKRSNTASAKGRDALCVPVQKVKDMEEVSDNGRVASDRALVSDQAASRLDAPRFDPSREQKFTVGFVIRDGEAWDNFWKILRTQYGYHDTEAPVRAFAFSASDMFAEQDFIDEVLNSDLDAYEKCEAIADIPCGNLAALREQWELSDSDGSGEADKTGTGLAEGDSADPKGIAQGDAA